MAGSPFGHTPYPFMTLLETVLSLQVFELSSEQNNTPHFWSIEEGSVK